MPKKLTKKITPTAWSFMKQSFPDDVAKMYRIDVPINRFNILLKSWRRNSKKSIIQKTNKQHYGAELGEIIDWLEENCSGQFYAQWQGGEIKSNGSPIQVVEFFFMDETDALGFKLMFE